VKKTLLLLAAVLVTLSLAAPMASANQPTCPLGVPSCTAQ
jgi:hypothetical protein